MEEKFKIRAVSFLLGFLSSLSLLLIYSIPRWPVFLVVLLVWCITIIYFDKSYQVRWENIALQFGTAISLFLIISLVERPWLPWFLVILTGILFIVIWQWSVFYNGKVSLELKPMRRLIVIIWTFNLFTYFVALLAAGIFFPYLWGWVLALVSGLLTGLVSWAVWWLYYGSEFKKEWIWPAVISLLFAELTIVFKILPFGYFAIGLLLTWIWYIVQLLIRFSIGSKGIIWRNQRWFLLANGILFIIVLYFIRWV